LIQTQRAFKTLAAVVAAVALSAFRISLGRGAFIARLRTADVVGFLELPSYG
jgi:hypothetical protein